MGVIAFSALVGLAVAVAVVGVVLFFVGGCRALGRMGERPWLFLVPLYGPYLLFRSARCVLLFGVALAGVAAVGAFWAMPTGFLQQFWVVPAAVVWVCYAWCVAAVAECFHAGVGWQVASFVLAPYVLTLVGAGTGPFDHGCVPVVTAPFRALEGRLWEHGGDAGLRPSDSVPPVEVLRRHGVPADSAASPTAAKKPARHRV